MEQVTLDLASKWTLERRCSSIIHPSRIPGLDYTANPYVGCRHDCVYCYAPDVRRRFRGRQPGPGEVAVKCNAAEVAARQLRRLTPGKVCLSTLTDPYQEVEERYRVTRGILGALLTSPMSVTLLTKSDLVLRDLDLLTRFPRSRCDVGISIATLDEEQRRLLEPRAPSIEHRFEVLAALAKAGIRTWVFMAPLLPTISADEAIQILERVEPYAESVLVDWLNTRGRVVTSIIKAMGDHPSGRQLACLYTRNPHDARRRRERYAKIGRRIREHCEQWGQSVTLVREGPY